jgi:hypothetical protein
MRVRVGKIGTVATSLSLVISLAACGGADGAKTGDSGMAASAGVEPAVVTIVAKDFAYEAPDTITGGLVTLRMVNQGPELHHIQLVHIGDGHTYAEFLEGLKNMQPGSPMPPWLHDVAGPNTPVPGGEQSITGELQPGTYAIVCFIPSADQVPHAMKGMMKELTVLPNTGPAATPPVSDIAVKMTDYAWEVTPEITAGKHIIRIENLAAQSHELFIAKLEPGKSMTDLAAWVDNQVGPPPGTPMGGISGMANGAVVYLPVDLTPGEYGLFCFLPDAKDGKPHTAHGMMKQITVM